MILKRITMVVSDFLWHGRKDAKHDYCFVSLPKLSRPLEYGGLVVGELHRTGIALRARWLWLQDNRSGSPLEPSSAPK